jgi:hypothetical protein
MFQEAEGRLKVKNQTLRIFRHAGICLEPH